MRYSSPGSRSRGAGRSRPDSASESRGPGISSAASAVRASDRPDLRMVLTGHELRPRRERLFEPAGKFFRWRESPALNVARTSSRAAQATSSLTTAAGSLAAACCSGLPQLELQTPAVLADFRIGPDFERAHFGEMRAQLHGNQSLAGLCRSESRHSSGACRCRSSSRRPRRLRRCWSSARVSELYRRNATGLLATSCRSSRSSSTRLAFFGSARHQTHGDRSRPCRRSKRAAVRREPELRRRWIERTNSTPRPRRPRDRDPDFRESAGACRTSAPSRRRRACGRSPGMKKPPLNRMASGLCALD